MADVTYGQTCFQFAILSPNTYTQIYSHLLSIILPNQMSLSLSFSLLSTCVGYQALSIFARDEKAVGLGITYCHITSRSSDNSVELIPDSIKKNFCDATRELSINCKIAYERGYKSKREPTNIYIQRTQKMPY